MNDLIPIKLSLTKVQHDYLERIVVCDVSDHARIVKARDFHTYSDDEKQEYLTLLKVGNEVKAMILANKLQRLREQP